MISLAEYSDKSFVVNGSTIDYKNKLKDLGGKWNPYLKTGPGWIFSNKRKSSVQDWMNNIEKDELVVSPPQKRRKLNNIKEVNVSNLQILKDVVLAIFVVSLIYLFNMYASNNIDFKNTLYASNNIDFKNTLYAYLSSGRAALAQSADYLNSYLYKFKVYTPTFLNNTC